MANTNNVDPEDPRNMSLNELEEWRAKHDADSMGHENAEGVNGDE
jgi:hypothetical protein